MHPKTVQKQHLLSTGTVPGTVRYRYRQEYFVAIRFFQKKHKIKKTDVYGTVPYKCDVWSFEFTIFLMQFEIGEYFWHYKLFYKRTYVSV